MGTTFFEALPSAAQSPLAMVGYLTAIAATVAIAFRVRRNKNLLTRIQDIPKGDRKELIQNEMNVVLPKEITAEQWLRSKLHQYYFIGSLVVILCLTLIAVITLTKTGGGGPGPAPVPGNEVLPNPDDPGGGTTNEDAPTNGVAPEPPTAREVTYSPAKLEDRTIDVCVAPSDQYQTIEQQCSATAMRMVADEFCRRKGHLSAASFKGENSGLFQTSYKLHHAMDADGNVQDVFRPFDQGGSIFTSITCR